jgi:hypothetical protein
MPTIDVNEAELVALIAAIRRWINEDPIPHVPRLDPLRAALVKLEKASRHPPKGRPGAS